MRGMEHQLVSSGLPEVDEERGVHHGDGEAACLLPFSDLKVVRSPLIEALKKGQWVRYSL